MVLLSGVGGGCCWWCWWCWCCWCGGDGGGWRCGVEWLVVGAVMRSSTQCRWCVVDGVLVGVWCVAVAVDGDVFRSINLSVCRRRRRRCCAARGCCVVGPFCSLKSHALLLPTLLSSPLSCCPVVTLSSCCQRPCHALPVRQTNGPTDLN